MKLIKRWAKILLPPILFRIFKSNGPSQITFSQEYPDWQQAKSKCQGYEANLILDKVLEATLKVKSGQAKYERDSVVFDKIQYSWPVTAAIMWAAINQARPLRVIDFGGSLGTTYFENRNLLRSLPKFSWAIVEQPNFVSAGNRYIADENLSFHTSIEDAVERGKPSICLLSAVLQYLENPWEIIDKVKHQEPNVIVFDRTIINKSAFDRIYIQQNPNSIIRSSYPCRSISLSKLLETMTQNYELQEQFDSIEFPALSSIDSKFIGMIFKRI